MVLRDGRWALELVSFSPREALVRGGERSDDESRGIDGTTKRATRTNLKQDRGKSNSKHDRGLDKLARNESHEASLKHPQCELNNAKKPMLREELFELGKQPPNLRLQRHERVSRMPCLDELVRCQCGSTGLVVLLQVGTEFLDREAVLEHGRKYQRRNCRRDRQELPG